MTKALAAAVAAAAAWMWLDPGLPPLLTLGATGWLLVRVWRRSAHPALESSWEKVRPISASSRTARRRGRQRRVQDGLASRSEITAVASARAVRKTTEVLRPQLVAAIVEGRARAKRAAGLTRLERARHVRTTDVGIRLCRVGRQWVWASLRHVVLHFGGPGAGKSGWLADRITEFRGSMIITSVRPDLYMNTWEVRARRGPVMVFNAAGLSNVPHEITFDPLTDCVNPEAAGERARDMIPEAHGEAEHWAGLARGVLAALMHAAALGGHSMDTVLQWVAKPTDHHATIVKLLRRSQAPAKLEAAEQFLSNNEKTRSSITTSIMPALDWLSSPTARAAAGLNGDRRPFRADTLLPGDVTVYVIGRVDVHTEPLLAALTGYVGRAARRAAVTSDRGRLDPPLGLALDEAARFRLPLPDWTSDMGGSGVPILACFQSLAQLVGVYGQDRGDEILNNAGAVLLGGGTKAAHDLDAWTKLAGDRDEVTSTTDEHGRATGTTQRVTSVLPPAVLANLAPQEVAVWRTGMPPALGRTRMVWERWDLHPPFPLRLLQELGGQLRTREIPRLASRRLPDVLPEEVEADVPVSHY